MRQIMARRKKTQFTGMLAQQIDDTTFNTALGAFEADSAEFNRRLQERSTRLYGLRLDKMPELGRQLGIDVAACDLKTHLGKAALYSLIAIELAIKLEIPGFMLTKPKWPPELVNYAMIHGHNCKKLGEPNPDLNVCLDIVRTLYPDLARPGRGSEAAPGKDVA
jgi:hypothetical protein